MNAREKWQEMPPTEPRKRSTIDQAAKMLAARGAQAHPPALADVIAEELYVAQAKGAWYAAERLQQETAYLEKCMRDMRIGLDKLYEAAGKVKEETGA